jgi:predicted nucleic acid-binding protein
MVRWHPHVASEILAVELRCTARRSEDAEEARRAEDVLSAIALIPWRAVTARQAGTLAFQPPLRALDAIHLATALTLQDDLAVLVAYDRELLAAARAEGLTVASPGMA